MGNLRSSQNITTTNNPSVRISSSIPISGVDILFKSLYLVSLKILNALVIIDVNIEKL